MLNELHMKLKNRVKQTPYLNRYARKIASILNVFNDYRIWRIQKQLAKDNRRFIFPPPSLQRRVVGGVFKDFLESGIATKKEIFNIMTNQGFPLSSSMKILDFGCGCGRVIQSFQSHNPLNLFGTDIDHEAVHWCKENISHIATFSVNDHNPPMHYKNNVFDFVYTISIFTHLPEDIQFLWLDELRRILKPSGLLLATVHGPFYHKKINDRYIASELEKKGFAYVKSPLTPGLPDFYCNAYHTHGYINNTWSRFFNVIKIIPRGISGTHDAILCQKITEESQP